MAWLCAFLAPNSSYITHPPTLSICALQDPCIFQQCITGNSTGSSPATRECAWHILTHQFGAGVPGQCAGHAFSRNLTNGWLWAIEAPYNLTVEVAEQKGKEGAGVQQIRLLRRERPHIFMVDGSPRYLYNGVSEDNGVAGKQWTMVTELRSRAPQ